MQMSSVARGAGLIAGTHSDRHSESVTAQKVFLPLSLSIFLPSSLPSIHPLVHLSLCQGECQASEMYAEQVKDLIMHSCPKKIAAFFAEVIQVII